MDGAVAVTVARSLDEIAGLEDRWNDVPWRGEQAEHAYFTAVAALRGAQPLAVLVGGEAALAGRIEERRLDTRFGYARIYAPRLRILQVVPGGVVAADGDALGQLVEEAGRLRGEVDAIALPALPLDSPVYAAFARLGGALERQRFVPAWTRRTLRLPESFEAFLTARTRKIRAGVRYDSKKLEEALGEGRSVDIVGDADDLERVVADLDSVAASTYQRALGAGFAATEERTAVLGIALRHGWARVYILREEGHPIAFWLCSTHHRTITLNATGYRKEYGALRPGIYLLMRVIEDACADAGLDVLDFGPGRSDYKRHFSDGGFQERNLIVFAPTARARTANVLRTGVLGAALVTRTALDTVGGTHRLRSAWRTRLRS